MSMLHWQSTRTWCGDDLGSGLIILPSKKRQKVNTQSSTETKFVEVEDALSRILRAKLFIESSRPYSEHGYDIQGQLEFSGKQARRHKQDFLISGIFILRTSSAARKFKFSSAQRMKCLHIILPNL